MADYKFNVNVRNCLGNKAVNSYSEFQSCVVSSQLQQDRKVSGSSGTNSSRDLTKSGGPSMDEINLYCDGRSNGMKKEFQQEYQRMQSLLNDQQARNLQQQAQDLEKKCSLQTNDITNKFTQQIKDITQKSEADKKSIYDSSQQQIKDISQTYEDYKKNLNDSMQNLQNANRTNYQILSSIQTQCNLKQEEESDICSLLIP